jgi:BON domain-containing protein
MVSPSVSRPSHVQALCGAFLLAGLTCGAAPANADRISTRVAPLQTVVVTGKNHRDSLPDGEVRVKVETALHSEPYFYDGHVTITVDNDVVRLQGVVFDKRDLRIAKRISRRVAGVKRVINELEIKLDGQLRRGLAAHVGT